MKWKEEDLPSLRELESTVVRLWSKHEAMNDYTAGRAYAATYRVYRARLRVQEPKPVNASGLDREAYDAVRQICEKLLATGATPLKGMPGGNTHPLALEKLVEYLRELTRSVERHTKLGGRRGYLAFVRGFIP